MNIVFNEIKGPEDRNYINFQDFKRACLKYQPNCLKKMIQELGVNSPSLSVEIEEHFRNVCESVASTVEQEKDEPASPKFAGAVEETTQA